jgi:transcriptional regulator with XRE-family HTH domain
MTNQFGERIRQLREKQELFLRQVAPSLDMDTAQLSKIEKGIRQIKKEQIDILAEVLKTNKEELRTLWLADQVSNLIEGEPMADEVLRMVSKNRNNK